MLLHVGVRVVDDGPPIERNLLANLFQFVDGEIVRGLQRHEVACPHQKNRSHIDEVVSSLLRPDNAHQQIVQRRELRFPKSRRVVAEVLEDVHGRPVDERRTVEHDQPGNVDLYAVDDVTICAVVACRKRILVIVGPGDARHVDHVEGFEIAAPGCAQRKADPTASRPPRP